MCVCVCVCVCACVQIVDGIITSLTEKLAPDFDNLDLKLRIGDKLTPYLVSAH